MSIDVCWLTEILSKLGLKARIALTEKLVINNFKCLDYSAVEVCRSDLNQLRQSAVFMSPDTKLSSAIKSAAMFQ